MGAPAVTPPFLEELLPLEETTLATGVNNVPPEQDNAQKHAWEGRIAAEENHSKASVKMIRAQDRVKKLEGQLRKLLTREGQSSKAMCSLFKEFDQDVSGKLSQSEFINGMQRVLGRHGIRSFRKDVETLMSKVDKNKDGSVDFSEFYNHLQGDSDPDDARKQNKDSEIK